MKRAEPYSVALPGAFPTSRLLSQLLVAGLLTLTVPRCLADRATYDPTKTWNAYPLDTPPVIDGDISDEEWLPYSYWSITVQHATASPVDFSVADGIQGGTLTGGTLPADNDDLRVRIRARYDANNLYVAVEVRDSSIMTDSADPDSRNGNTWMDSVAPDMR